MRSRVIFFVLLGRIFIQKIWTEIFDGVHIILCSSPVRLRVRVSRTNIYHEQTMSSLLARI